MKALVFETPDNPKILDQPIPEINDTEVLVQTRTVGICHSDYELLAGRYIIPISYPVIPGHEWCGEIVEVGKSVSISKKATALWANALCAPQSACTISAFP
jgi:L-iditol 2-dehydrogenase